MPDKDFEVPRAGYGYEQICLRGVGDFIHGDWVGLGRFGQSYEIPRTVFNMLFFRKNRSILGHSFFSFPNH